MLGRWTHAARALWRRAARAGSWLGRWSLLRDPLPNGREGRGRVGSGRDGRTVRLPLLPPWDETAWTEPDLEVPEVGTSSTRPQRRRKLAAGGRLTTTLRRDLPTYRIGRRCTSRLHEAAPWPNQTRHWHPAVRRAPLLPPRPAMTPPSAGQVLGGVDWQNDLKAGSSPIEFGGGEPFNC